MSDSPQTRTLALLRERQKNSLSRQTNDEYPMILRSEDGRICHPYFQIKEEIFLFTPLEVEEATSF